MSGTASLQVVQSGIIVFGDESNEYSIRDPLR
jgi:hypothetical protein